jgi:putative ABC transport system permease protein
MTLQSWTEITLIAHKMAARLLAALGLISLLLAAVGLYSVVAYAVIQRRQELGIRIALGAGRRQVLFDVLVRALALSIGGLGLGTVAAYALAVVARSSTSLLIDVRSTDPASFLGASLVLILVAAVASYLPALRATRVDPIVALRCE